MVIVVLAILMLVILIWQLNSLRDISKKQMNSECVSDSDCVKVQSTCCPCSSGGEEKCVNKQEAENYSKNLENCGEVFCAQVYSCIIEKCRCVGGKCSD